MAYTHIPSDEDAIWSTFPTFRKTGPYPQRNYTSGIITLYDSFKFAHGYIEMRARAPAGSGLLSVFGMLNGYSVAQQPEIDIMAVLGEKPNEVFHGYRRRMNNGLPAPQDSSTTSPGDASIAYSDDFYTYGVRWRHNTIEWSNDGDVVHTYTGDGVAYQVMYVIANLSLGGNGNSVTEDTSSGLPASLDIDYIRIYQERDPE